MKKHPATSLTVWFDSGILTFLALALILPEVAAIIPDPLARYVLAFVAVVNLALRYFKTTQPIR